MADIGRIIRIWLHNNEWTQARLADALGVSESTVQKCANYGLKSQPSRLFKATVTEK